MAAHVTFLPQSALIHCSGCGERIPLSRATMRNQERIVEELKMAEDLHLGCAGLSPQEASLERRWREVMIRERYSGTRQPDRLAWSA